jgi:fructose-bisphosphate aldolase class I
MRHSDSALNGHLRELARPGVAGCVVGDEGLASEADGVQLMKPVPDLDKLLERAVKKGIYGTKERSVIKEANPAGIKAIAAQQFEWGKQVLAHGLVPILEPEVDIKSPNKAECEKLLKKELLAGLDGLKEGQQVIFKLTIPSEPDFYADLIKHPKTARVVALSGGYSREEACEKLAKNHGMIASFSRALTEGLTAQQSDQEFNTMLKGAVGKIYQASIS